MDNIGVKIMKKLYQILLFSLVLIFSLNAESLTYDSFVKKYKEVSKLYNQKNYKEALEILDTLAEDEFANIHPSVYLSRALVLNCLQKYEEAKEDIEKCILKEPYSLKPRLVRSIIYFGLKDYENSLKDIDYCLKKKPDWAEALHQKGLINLNLRNYKEALLDFENCILNADEIKPEFLSDRGFAYYFLNNYENAKEDFLYSLKSTENDDVYLCLIDVCYKLQQFDEGLKYADILIKKGKRIESALIERAYIYLTLERYEEVKHDLESIKEKADNLSSYHKVFCVYYILTHNRVDANKEIDKAYQLNKTDDDILLLKSLLQNSNWKYTNVLNELDRTKFEF